MTSDIGMAGELTTRLAVAAPTANAYRTCAEASDEWSGKSCANEYGEISQSAAKCCGGGASYCPAPKLCADPAAFDPAANHDYSCYAMITASFTEANCSAAGCYNSDGDGGQRYCSCPVTGSDACLAKLPGKLSRACVRACVRGV